MNRVPFPRFILRCGGMLLIFLGTSCSYLFIPGNRRSLAARTQWLQRWSRRTLHLLEMEVRVKGEGPGPGLIASNHLSYLDILVLSSIRPQVFLAKKEVEGWPLFGAFARWAGSIFIDRRRRSEVSGMSKSFQEVITAGLPVTVFLEGTTTDGSTVLPFRTALLESALRADWPVTPCAIHYEANGTPTADTICYHGDMTLIPHLLGLLRRVDRSRALVSYGSPSMKRTDRKSLAADLHRSVVTMKQVLRENAG